MHSELGVSLKANYAGKHRDCNMPKGIGLIPLGDRNRAPADEGFGVVEERISVDKYSKYAT